MIWGNDYSLGVECKKTMLVVTCVKTHWALAPHLHNQQLITTIIVNANGNDIYSKSKYYNICKRDEKDVYKTHTQ